MHGQGVVNLSELQGDYFTGGGINFSLQSSGVRDADEPSNSGLSAGFTGYLGKFATNQLAYGVMAGYNYASTTYNPNTDLEWEDSQSLLNLGLFGRAYSNPCSPNVNGYIQGEVGLGTGAFQSNVTGMDVKENVGTFWAGVRPGIVLYPTEHIMLELQYGFLGYRSEAFSSEDPVSGNETTNYNRWGGFDFDAKTLTICLMYRLPYPSWNSKMDGAFDGFGTF